MESGSDEAVNESREEPTDKVEQNYSKKRIGEGNIKLDQERLAQAISEEKKRKFRSDGGDDNMGKKRKNIQQGGSHDVTEEELGEFLVFFCPCNGFTDSTPRGIPNEPSNDGRPYGELRGHREVKALVSLFSFTNCVYIMPVIMCQFTHVVTSLIRTTFMLSASRNALMKLICHSRQHLPFSLASALASC